MTEISPSKFNLRNCTNGIDELVDSIKKNGILHPITVRIREKGFEIVAGNRKVLCLQEVRMEKDSL